MAPGELMSPSTDPVFLLKLLRASLETLAMSALGTLIAAVAGLALALGLSDAHWAAISTAVAGLAGVAAVFLSETHKA